MRRHPALFAILIGGGVAATLDLLYAIIYSWIRAQVPPLVIMQSVASGLIGQAAYEGGVGTAVLGVVCHFAIAFIIASIFWLASRRLGFMARNASRRDSRSASASTSS